jgi:beta-glucuronidase
MVWMKKSLNGKWQYFIDYQNDGIDNEIFSVTSIKDNISSYSFIDIPSCWNSIKGLERYEGHFWYFKIFKIEDFDPENHDFFLCFNGINYRSKIWINGCYLGSHEGGFLPFNFKIHNENLNLKSNNYLAIQVENLRKRGRIPGKLFDWYNWGGIYRGVYFNIIPKLRIDWVHIKTKLEKNKAQLVVDYKITRAEKFHYTIKFRDKTIKTKNIRPVDKKGSFKIYLDKPQLWTPEHPNLYEIKVKLDKNHFELSDRFGIREIKTHGSFLYLNNKRIKLYGVNLHEELMPYGRSIPYEKRREDLQNIKKLGFNALRSAHYSHDESLLELADEIGLLVLEEIPVYWNMKYKSIETLKLAAKMIRALIYRDYNHPSVLFWSVGNEVPIESIQCHRFMLLLVNYAKKLDPTRLVSYVSSHFLSDHYRRKTDIATLNEYFGWYFLSVQNLNYILEMTRGMAFNKPWFITEFGAGAKKGFNSPELEKFSEEKQAYIISRSIKIFNSKDWIAGWFIWIYRDFKSAIRTNQYQKGFNRKGLVSEKNEKKLIAKIMPKIIKKSIKTRKYPILAKFMLPLGFFFSYIFKIMDLANIFQEKMMDEYYDTHP